MSQTHQVVFLETSIQVQRAFATMEQRARLTDIFAAQSIQWISSTYVWMEYQRTVVADYAHVHRVMGQYSDWASLFEHLLDGSRAFRPRSAGRCTQIVAQAYRASDGVYAVGRELLRTQISRDLRKTFWTNVLPIQEKIVCDLVGIGVTRQSGENFTVADSCRKETATCHLPDFLAQHQPELCAIRDYLTAHPNAVKDQSRVERLLTTVIEEPRAALGQASCWPLGDVIIALQVPENAALWTLDSDFAPLLTAIGRRLYVAQ